MNSTGVQPASLYHENWTAHILIPLAFHLSWALPSSASTEKTLKEVWNKPIQQRNKYIKYVICSYNLPVLEDHEAQMKCENEKHWIKIESY